MLVQETSVKSYGNTQLLKLEDRLQDKLEDKYDRLDARTTKLDTENEVKFAKLMAEQKNF